MRSYSRSIANQTQPSSFIIIITINAYHCSLFNVYQTVTAYYCAKTAGCSHCRWTTMFAAFPVGVQQCWILVRWPERKQKCTSPDERLRRACEGLTSFRAKTNHVGVSADVHIHLAGHRISFHFPFGAEEWILIYKAYIEKINKQLLSLSSIISNGMCHILWW